VVKEKKTKDIEWSCPHCGYTVLAPETANSNMICPRCGHELNVGGVEVEDKEASKILKETEKHRKEEIETDEDY
jgi:uncharacterized Zn finger protein (UPF0148 family)